MRDLASYLKLAAFLAACALLGRLFVEVAR